MGNMKAVVEQFLEAFHRGDVQTARRFLTEDFVFVGPSIRYEGPDKYLKAAAHVAFGYRGMDLLRAFEDGSEVALFYEMKVAHAVERVPIAAWFQFTDGRISAIRQFLDTAPFMKSSASQKPEHTAIDPVCGMSVDTRSPPATCEHAGRTWYFCNPGCAEAFKATPAKFLPQ